MSRMPRKRFSGILTMVLVVLLWAAPGAAQTSHVRTMIVPNQANVLCVEERGMVRLTADGKTYEKRYVLRYSETTAQWNGKLLIGAHGGSGGSLYAREGWVMDTSEIALDDIIGANALDRGYAYASVDRDGVGGAREGAALTDAFTAWVRERVQAVHGRSASRVYLAGLSAGGAVSRYAAEDPAPKYDGVLLIAGGGGATTPQFERQARLATLWPDADPARQPQLPPTDAKVKAYAQEIGTPVEARRFWPFVGRGQSIAGLKRSLEGYGLTGLTDAQLQNFRMKPYEKNAAFMEKVAQARAAGASGRLTVPTIEVTGTYDDIVISGILDYKEKVKAASRNAVAPTPADRHRLYQVAGAWHISPDDDAMQSFQYTMSRMGFDEEWQDRLATGTTYIPTVQEAFDHLDRWVTQGTAPPPDQTVQEKEKLKK